MLASTRNKLLLIFVITFFATYVGLPKEINLGNNQTFVKRDIKYIPSDLVLGLDLVGGSHLVFEANTQDLDDEKKESALLGLKEVVARRVNLFGVSEPNIQLSRFDDKDRLIVELPGIYETQKAVELVGTTAQLSFAEIGEDGSSLNETQLTGSALKNAQVDFSQVSGEPVVSIEFTSEGATIFTELTKNNLGKPLPILLDGAVISAPVVQQEITGGQAQITGSFSLEEAKELSIQLNAGALPLSLELIEQRTVGASLGEESVQKSIHAGLVGLGLVLVFMVIFYGKLGLVADIGLIIFGIITLALYKIIPVVLTLPGIAGFLLSVGMAVDANILIFERFREEKSSGVNILFALETSFGRAWDSIRDANIATLVTAFILANPLDWPFLHTSGPVRGFAITLSVGIAVSLFTGVVVSRNLLRFFIRDNST